MPADRLLSVLPDAPLLQLKVRVPVPPVAETVIDPLLFVQVGCVTAPVIANAAGTVSEALAEEVQPLPSVTVTL